MRAYIDGKLSTRQSCFLPTNLWFANSEEDFDFEVTENCIRLDGVYTEGGVNEDDTFSCRWKGVELVCINDKGEYHITEDFTVDKFSKLIKEKNMRLVNMDAYFDTDVDVSTTKFKLVDHTGEFELDPSLIDEIGFIA